MPMPTERPAMTLLFSAPDELFIAGCVAAVAVELDGSDTVVVEVRAAIVGSLDAADAVLARLDIEVADVAKLDVDDASAEEVDSMSFSRQPIKSCESRKSLCAMLRVEKRNAAN
jgi:hypothetical protein